jgi:hypothetical protein
VRPRCTNAALGARCVVIVAKQRYDMARKSIVSVSGPIAGQLFHAAQYTILNFLS